MRRSPALLVLLLAACSSGTPSAGPASSPDEATASPTASVTPAATAAPHVSPTATPTPSPTPHTAATASPRPMLTSSPAPHRTRTPSRSASPTPRPTPSPTRQGTTYGIDQVTGDRFSPSTVTLRVGDYVLVTDKDSVAPHTFTIDALHADSGGMSQGDTYRYRFLKAGTFDFVCSYHQNVGMTGTVTVKP